MYGILGEHESDVATLKVLVRRLVGNDSLPIKGKGYGGSGKMLQEGARQLRAFRNLGCSRFIVCLDADGPDPVPARKNASARIVQPSGIGDGCCIVVPVQELEAWILADIECAMHIFPGWRPAAVPNPEHVPNPKEHLEKLSRDSKQKPRYRHAVHNVRMATHLDLAKISQKCPAFRELARFVA